MNRLRLIPALIVAINLLALAPAIAVSGGKPLVVLISIDGFRADYLHRGNSPTLDALAKNGTSTRGLVPSFPSVTFPNHYSMATGLFPDHHGIVNNTMSDPTIPGPSFALLARGVLANPRWWEEGVPIWVTLKRNGKRSSTLFWPGSEVVIDGVRPDDWLAYNDAMASAERADKLLSWLDRSDEERADFATLYFSEVDTTGHRFGPDSPEVGEAVKRVDSAVQAFVAGLDRLGLRDQTDLVIVADHGMAEVDPAHAIALQGLLSGLATAKIQWIGAVAGISVGAQEREAALKQFASETHMSCWRKAAMPERFHFGTHRRIPDIVCLAQIGWTVVAKSDQPITRGQHGYDPAEQMMWGLFLATGPRIKQQELDLVENVNIYPLLCRLLGVQPEPNDASEELAGLVIK